MCKQGLFPTAAELVSLNVEFGVMIKCTENGLIVTAEVTDESKGEAAEPDSMKTFTSYIAKDEKRISFRDDFQG